MRKFMKTHSTTIFVLSLLCLIATLALYSCGGGGGGGSGSVPGNNTSGNSSLWDTMKWDNDAWQ